MVLLEQPKLTHAWLDSLAQPAPDVHRTHQGRFFLSVTVASTLGEERMRFVGDSSRFLTSSNTFMYYVAIGAVIAAMIVLIRVGLPFLLRAIGLETARFSTPDRKIVLIEWIFLAFCLGLFSYLSHLFETYQSIGVILLGLGFALVPSFNFVLRPFLTSLRGEITSPSSKLVKHVHNELGADIEVKVHSRGLVNAYAIGVLPTSKTIILGKPLVEKLDLDEIHAVVAHEVGHLRMSHLPIIYLINVLCVAAFGFAMSYLYRVQVENVLFGLLLVAAVGAIAGALFFGVIPGLITRKLEYDADRFAAQKVGVQCYKRALLKLDDIMDKKLSGGDMAHPPLKQRLQHVGAYESNQKKQTTAHPGA